MAETAPQPQSPFGDALAELGAVPDGASQVRVAPLPVAGHVSLRGKAHEERFLSAVREAIGFDLPKQAGEVAEGETGRVFWLGPDHWLICREGGTTTALVAELQTELEGRFAAALDVSGARAGLRLSGEAAADILAAGCRLDLSPDAFGAGKCVQAPLGNVTALIHCVALEPPAYDLYVPRSQARSFCRWLAHAGREFGLRAVSGQPEP